jgi:cobalt/nickel transport system permease protein
MFGRALIAVGFLSALSLSTPTQDIITGLQGLKLPSIIVLTLNLTIRYLFVLREEFLRMHKSWNSRYFGKYFWFNVSSIGKRLGILFIRTTERAERVSNCMLSRGFDIHRVQQAKLQITRTDLLFLVFALLLLSLITAFSILSLLDRLSMG